MQFFWSALKLIIPLSSCVFFKEKCYTLPCISSKKTFGSKKLSQTTPEKSLQPVNINRCKMVFLGYSTDKSEPTPAFPSATFRCPNQGGGGTWGELARYIRVLVELSRNSQKYKKIDFSTLDYGGKLVCFGSLKLFAFDYRGKGGGAS